MVFRDRFSPKTAKYLLVDKKRYILTKYIMPVVLIFIPTNYSISVLLNQPFGKMGAALNKVQIR